ncbi:carboxymuconolactone decarboxylase family protein [Flavisphingomonas formosensis]|uniref:carboxymuconolactone decarboxylase family protein n=1 Tax=Flavisphingomonas formosensis TaxID=861534 RepID=UPI0012FB030B|nr:carboxymuconolactone decarboxylase family protein [Sphingomonas formosensis]
MARLTALEPDEFAPEVRHILGETALVSKEKLGVARIWAQRPDLMAAYFQFRAALMAASTLSPRLIELLRLRIALHNQCRSCMAVRYSHGVQEGVTEDLVCQLADPEEATDLSDRERAALRYADLLATDHVGISDATFDDLRQHFSEPEIVELCAHCAAYVGFGRVSMSWDMVDDLPERFHDRSGKVTPWGGDSILV